VGTVAAVPIEDAEELAAALPQDRLRFERFPDAGHLLAAEHPETIQRPVRDFLLEDQAEGGPAG
jgi:pimeloyl-ACP methyl ester carboxylesterase